MFSTCACLTSGETTFTISCTSGHASLQLFDMRGRLVHTGNVELQAGLNELALPLKSVRNGMYIFKLTGNDISGTVKVLKN
ncbi:T9SS type A sorting domain-containing protein [Pontibacter toksunensis]